jgi:hypothetical protein
MISFLFNWGMKVVEFEHRPRCFLSAGDSAGSQEVVQLNALCVSESCHFRIGRNSGTRGRESRWADSKVKPQSKAPLNLF